MKEREILESLKNKPVFSVQDIQRKGNFSREYSKVLLNRLIKRKVVFRITQNRYTQREDIYLVSTNLKFPSYLSFWSASSYYECTEQILKTVYIACTRNINPLIFQGYKIKFVKLKDFFGYRKVRTSKGDIFIVQKEKLLIDCFLKFNEMGNFDEIIKTYKNLEISEEKLIEYLKKINNLSLIKRVGFMLERYKNLDISKEFSFDNNYVLLNMFSKKYKKTNSKWRVKHDL